MSIAQKIWTGPYLLYGRLLFGLKVEGVENIPLQGPCILVFNHASPIVDGYHGVIARRVRQDWRMFGNEAMMARRAMARFSRRAGMFPAYRNPGQSMSVLREALETLREGKGVMLTSQEITWDGRLYFPRPGPAWLALRSGAPVVASVVKGGYDIWPRWAKWPKLTGKCSLRISKPFYLSGGSCDRVTSAMIRQASQRILDKMTALISR